MLHMNAQYVEKLAEVHTSMAGICCTTLKRRSAMPGKPTLICVCGTEIPPGANFTVRQQERVGHMTRPSSLELVEAYEERWHYHFLDPLCYLSSMGLFIVSGTQTDPYGMAIALFLIAVVALTFEESAQNAYEYTHREHW